MDKAEDKNSFWSYLVYEAVIHHEKLTNNEVPEFGNDTATRC